RAGGLRFAGEAARGVGARFGEHLDGDVAMQPRVARAIDLAHPAGAHRARDHERTESFRQRRHQLRTSPTLAFKRSHGVRRGVNPSISQTSELTCTMDVRNAVGETRANPRTGLVAIGSGTNAAVTTCSTRDRMSSDVSVRCVKSSL